MVIVGLHNDLLGSVNTYAAPWLELPSSINESWSSKIEM